MCVWPQTTSETPRLPKIGRSSSSGVRRVKISMSLRGVAWQKSTSPMPSTSTRHVSGQPAISTACSGLSCSAFQRIDGHVDLGHLTARRNDLPIAVASDELDRQIQREQALERLARHRSGQDVAAHDDAIDTRLADFGKDRIERRQVAVNVVERRDACRHRYMLRRVVR